MRQTIFELLDHMSARKQELTDKFVPVSICTQLQQAIRDTEVSCLLFCFFLIWKFDLDGCHQSK